MKNLSKISINKVVEIISFKHQMVAKKLITMGVIPGREVEILRKAPFGGAYYIRVSDLYFAIRKAEAKTIIVKE
ncbi:MAG: ferrous iron transport protein A [Planctomycetota bacterium]